MEQETQTPHKRRVRYKGKYPKKFEEKYKELQPEKYQDTIEHVIRMIRHSFLSRSTQVQLPKVVPRQQRLLWQQIRTWMHSSRQAAAVTLFRVQSQQ